MSQHRVIRLCWFDDKNIQETVSIAQIYSSLCNGKNKQADIDEVIVRQEINNHIEYIIKQPLQIDSWRDNAWKNELIFNLSLIDNLNDLIAYDLNKKYGWEGKNFTTKFEESVVIYCDFEQELKIQNCTFDKGLEILLDIKTNFAKGVVFENCKFNGKVSFKNAVFGSKEQMEFVNIFFKDCEFKDKVDFSNCKFYGNVYFNNSIFKECADFHESEFNKTACFYGVTFEKTPNFSQVIFKNNLNLVNSNLNFDFDECEKTFDKELSIHEEKETDIQNLTPKLPNKAPYKIANDFRDSFRGFKNALIKDNNLLDASNYHKIELYFKEIELKRKKPKIFSKEWIDLWQLKLYRLTSNHHTDLLKAFNSLMILIGVFALFGFLIMCLFNAYYGFYKYNPHSMIEFYNTHIANFVPNNISIMVLINTILIFLWLFIFFVCQICGLIRKFCISLYYLATFSLLILSPKYLIPAIGIFTDKRTLLDPLSINGGLYTIFFGFIVYSFIKTVRRNSIIPA